MREIDFSTTYTVNVSGSTITPDPTDSDPKDELFLYLVSLKTSILIVSGELRTYALSSIKIVDGPSSIDSSAVFNNLKILSQKLQDEYAQAKILAQSARNGEAIMTPYTNSRLWPDYWSR